MTTTMTCAQVDTQLAEWLEGTLAAPAAHAVRVHVAGCSRCSAALTALDVPLGDAAALPELQPAHDLWAGIEERIATPVVALAARPAAPLVVRRRFGWVAQTAAAVALVTVSTGTTWMYASRVLSKTTNEIAALSRDEIRTQTRESIRSTIRGTLRGEARAVSTEGSLPSIEHTYDLEVGALRDILLQRRAELDPATVAVLDRNLRLIDRAIAESREALARNPANQVIGDQLAVTLDKKLQLLRTAALLPPRA